MYLSRIANNILEHTSTAVLHEHNLLHYKGVFICTFNKPILIPEEDFKLVMGIPSLFGEPVLLDYPWRSVDWGVGGGSQPIRSVSLCSLQRASSLNRFVRELPITILNALFIQLEI